MEKGEAKKSPFSNIMQVGIVVKDINKAMEHFSSLGIGPFKVSPRGAVPAYIDLKTRGKPADYKMEIRFAQVGNVEIELIQPLEGESIHKDFLEEKGEGLHHLGFSVDDLDGEEAKLVEQGFKVLASGRFF